MKNSLSKSASLIIFFSFLCIFSNSQDLNRSFRPGLVWPDNQGRHINAHGGAIIIHEGTYYWFGESRLPRQEKDRTRYGVGCYSSKDLLNWKNEGLALRVINDSTSLLQPGCVIERPKVIYNRKTGKFIMWFHHELKGKGYAAAMTGVAVSDNVTGPYRYIRSLRPNAGVWPANLPEENRKPAADESSLKRGSEQWLKSIKDGYYVRRDFEGGQMARDMTVFVEKNGRAWHVHSSEENMTLHFSELTDDYLDFTGKYYMFTSGTTGWKPNPARLSVADKITGEWKTIGNPCRGTEDENKVTFSSQSTNILPIPGKKNAFIYMGDRWIPENLADSRHIWLPVEWENGMPVIKWYNSWDLKKF